MCPPAIAAIAPFIPLISKFVGGGNRQQQQAPRHQTRGAEPISRIQRRQGQRVDDENQRTEETKTRQSEQALQRKQTVREGVNAQAQKAQQTGADLGLVAPAVTPQTSSGLNQ